MRRDDRLSSRRRAIVWIGLGWFRDIDMVEILVDCLSMFG
jgi:hypothetical protein